MSEKPVKPRLLHPRLAAILADLRHGEMIYLADAGSGTSPKALFPLDEGVEKIDLAIATNLPTFEDVAAALIDHGDIEAAIVTEDMKHTAPSAREWIGEKLGADKVYEINYLPNYYHLRNKCKVFVQTGDYRVQAQAVLIAGYASADIPVEVLLKEGNAFDADFG